MNHSSFGNRPCSVPGPHPRAPIRSLLAVVLLLALGLVVITLVNYRTAVRVANETLRNQGISFDLNLAAEAWGRGAWNASDLQKLVDNQHRREIAFLAIVDRDGRILAHTNPQLDGTLLEDSAFLFVRQSGRLTGKMVTLGTGEEVYELTMPFHVPPEGPGSVTNLQQPRFRILRLALHTAPARRIVYQAQAQLLFVGVLVAVLLGLSVWQIHTLRRYLTLSAEAARQDRLAAVGTMAAVLAHEIRNPLGAIKGLAQFLGEKRANETTDREMTLTIASEAKRLERLVNDLLAYARPRPPQLQPTDLPAVLREAVTLAQPAGGAAGVKVHLEVSRVPPKVMADPEQMKQLVENLVLNALQAMPKGGTVTIAAGPPKERSKSKAPGSMSRFSVPSERWIEVSVADTGPGIPKADLPRIFEPFYTTRTKGSGLGLAICRQIAEAHGGTIRVARTGPEGTTIAVLLPHEVSSDG